MTADEVKAAVRERDGHVCTKCGMTADQHRERYGRTLQVHRTQPGSFYTIDGCVTLCCGCHGPEPKRARGEPDAEKYRDAIHVRLTLDTAAHDELRVMAAMAQMSMARYAEMALLEAIEQKRVLPPPAPGAKPRGRPRKSS